MTAKRSVAAYIVYSCETHYVDVKAGTIWQGIMRLTIEEAKALAEELLKVVHGHKEAMYGLD